MKQISLPHYWQLWNERAVAAKGCESSDWSGQRELGDMVRHVRRSDNDVADLIEPD